jgi:2-hydroxychromene-2-carboxylate isomerase
LPASHFDGRLDGAVVLEFWFEFGSTYSYPTAMRIEGEAARAGVEVRWRPFLLGPIFKTQGWNDSPFNLYPAKGRYMWRDLERICGTQGLTLKRPSQFPRNGLLAARIAACNTKAPWLPEFVRAVYTANFARDEEISDKRVLARCLDTAGEKAAPRIAEAESEDAKAKLRSATEEAERRGIFGAPSFWVAPELFWGNDRLEEALAWAQRRPGAGPSYDQANAIRRARPAEASRLSDIAFRSKAHWGYDVAFM